jgi:adenylate cyclase
MLAELDAEEVKRRVDGALAAMDAEVARFGGSREKFIGDAIFAVFGFPRAHDDDALRAGLCGLAIRAALEDLAQPGEEPLAVRIGIATGEVVAGTRNIPGTSDVSLTGPAVVIAARIQGLAGPGEILIDETTLRGSRGRLLADERGSRTLRGNPGAISVYALRGDLGLQHGAPPTGRLIGRSRERARLRTVIDTTRSTGLGRVAVVVGDAGIGKSRLLADLQTDARAAGLGWTFVENVSYGTGEPYRFLRAFAQAIADERGTDSGTMARHLLFGADLDEARARRIAGAIAAVAREAAFSGWEAEAPFAPTDPADVRAAVLEAALRYTYRLAEMFGPRVIVVDDLHWADFSSLPVLEQLVVTAPKLPFAVLIGSRPGPLPEWLTGDGIDRLVVGGLDESEVGILAADVAGAALDSDDARFVHGRTGGNPLFVSETVRALLEDGQLELREGRMHVVRSPQSGQLPVTLRALLGARIDALPRAAREVVGVASVIGITFTRGLVEDLLGRSLRPSAVDRLVEAALVARVDRDSWRFAHGLIRDAAYAGLLTSRRRALHARLADRFEADPGVGIGRAAVHRAQAGDSERAVPMLDAAASAALAVGASSEAASFWRMAADLIPVTDERRARYARRAGEAMRTAQAPRAQGSRLDDGVA